MSSSALDNVIGGRLKLKRSTVSTTESGQPKKRKKKSKQPAADEEKLPEPSEQPAPVVIVPPTKTQAEIKFEQTRQKLEEKLIAKKIEKTHRQKIEQFNNHLSTLSEHYDIPKVGPG